SPDRKPAHGLPDSAFAAMRRTTVGAYLVRRQGTQLCCRFAPRQNTRERIGLCRSDPTQRVSVSMIECLLAAVHRETGMRDIRPGVVSIAGNIDAIGIGTKGVVEK